LLTKRGFDVTLLMILLAHPAFGLLRMSSRRWVNELDGPLATVGNAVQVSL
jgi:hypothetical protein